MAQDRQIFTIKCNQISQKGFTLVFSSRLDWLDGRIYNKCVSCLLVQFCGCSFMCMNLQDIVFMYLLIRHLDDGSRFDESSISLDQFQPFFCMLIICVKTGQLSDSRFEATTELYVICACLVSLFALYMFNHEVTCVLVFSLFFFNQCFHIPVSF